ncbi:serine/threonine transporter SstT [Campylobacter hyointestinalis subsp. hyointestinalis]|nr:serine/threonine transporter SstT [Campylobacter hyointestinalis subsp. hyointestinalis]
MGMLRGITKRYMDGNLILQIIIGIVLGAVLGFIANSGNQMALSIANSMSILGSLFVGALKSVAPILVFILVSSSIYSKRVWQCEWT